MSRTILAESRLQLAQALRGDAVPDAVVAVNDELVLLVRLRVGNLDLDGDDLLLELAGLLSGSGAAEGLGGEGVLSGAGDLVGGGNVLACELKRKISFGRRKGRVGEKEETHW